MAYTEMLNILISDSGLTIKEIAEKCKEYGVDITTTYISKLKNDTNNKAPSDRVSIALAKACGAKYSECLVVEAYLDKSPQIITDFFNEFKKLAAPIALSVFENKITSQQQKEVEKLFENMPMSNFIFEVVKENGTAKIKKEYGTGHLKAISTGEDITIKQEITQNFGLEVSDDGMKPQICKGDRVQFEFKKIEELKTGDIICYAKKDTKNKVFVRKIVFNNNRRYITLLPNNSEFVFDNTEIDKITIIGKVVRVTSEIK